NKLFEVSLGLVHGHDGEIVHKGLARRAPRSEDWHYGMNGDRKLERRAVSDFRFHPDLTSTAFDDLLAERQSNSGSGDFFSMEPFENPEDPRRVLRIDAHSIVADRELPGSSRIFGRYVDPRCFPAF